MDAIVLEDQFEGFARQLTDLGRQEFPFAAARAITETALDAQDRVEREIEKTFDRPNAFTKRAVGVIRASKARPVATVFIKRKQAGYLRLQVEGGTRHPQRNVLPDPVGARTNAYGNLPRKAIARMLARPDTFKGRINSTYGIWQRMPGGKGLKLLVAFDKVQVYRPIFAFYATVERTVERRLKANFGKELAKAIATSRTRNIKALTR